jgi:predicted GNAT family acetyltransferase
MVDAGRARLWVDGAPACMAAVTRESRNGATISWVYTPIDRRGRGYATSLVAAYSQELLDAGKSFCTLDTDLANPTSNGIYRRIGYGEIERHRRVGVLR